MIKHPLLHIVIFMIFLCVKLVIRTYLETEAMTKSRFMAEKYIDKKKICSDKEKEELLAEFDKINKMGIPFMIDNLMTSRIDWGFSVCHYNIFCIRKLDMSKSKVFKFTFAFDFANRYE